MEQLASDGDDRLQLGLVTTQECFVERLQMGIETNGNEGGHVERATRRYQLPARLMREGLCTEVPET
jgi:hypothetical protein